jgi:hypothetical protein
VRRKAGFHLEIQAQLRFLSQRRLQSGAKCIS